MKKTKRDLIVVFVHIVSWLIFLSLSAVFNPRRHGISVMSFVNDLLEPPRWTNALLLLIVFYTNYYLTIPRLYIQRKYLFFGCTLVGWLTVFSLLNYLMMPGEIKNAAGRGGFDALGNSFNLFMFIIVYAFSFALCVYEQWQSTKERMLRTEISFLKAQVNPHFLFNALNNIYSLALTKSDATPDAILKLSGIMRYALSEGSQSHVLLSKELDYITDYVELQKLRLSEKVKLSYEIAGTPEEKQIVPFMLIPFVENAFRHGVNSEESSDIRIFIGITESTLILHVTNNKVNSKPDKYTGTRLGVNAVRKQLQLLYPGKHTLAITEDSAEFRVSLQIQIT